MKTISAYQYRRYIELVQVLASDKPETGLRALCGAWGIIPHHISNKRLDSGSTAIALARAAVENHKDDIK